MSLFPDDDKERKALPIFKMIVGYFPKAMREITRVCVANNQRFNPGREPADISWAKGKSPDQLGSAFRHMMERAVDGKKFETVGGQRIYVLAEAAWRLCAELELEIEREESGVLEERHPDADRIEAQVDSLLSEIERVNGLMSSSQREYAARTYRRLVAEQGVSGVESPFTIPTAHPIGCLCAACDGQDNGD